MSAINFRNAANTAWTAFPAVNPLKVRLADNSNWLDETNQTAKFAIRNATDTGWIYHSASPPPPSFPSALTFSRNDLEFHYSNTLTNSDPAQYMQVVMTLNTTNFFNTMTRADGHIIMALNPRGQSHVFAPNGTRDHCGPVIRNGEYVFDEARGFIILRNGQLMAEHWYAGAGAGLTDLGYGFNPITNPIFTVRIRGGYRTGSLGDRMEIDVFSGTTTAGPLLTGASIGWGWDWNGQHRFLLGAIGYFVEPATTGCVETSAAGASVGSTIAISNFAMTLHS